MQILKHYLSTVDTLVYSNNYIASIYLNSNYFILYVAIYAYVIVKDNVTDDEDTIIDDLKMVVKQHIGSFAVPHCFMVTASHCIRAYVADCFNKIFTVKCF